MYKIKRDNLYRLIQESGIKVAKIAKIAGYNNCNYASTLLDPAVSNSQKLSLEKVFRIAYALDCYIDDIVELEDSEKERIENIIWTH